LLQLAFHLTDPGVLAGYFNWHGKQGLSNVFKTTLFDNRLHGPYSLL